MRYNLTNLNVLNVKTGNWMKDYAICIENEFIKSIEPSCTSDRSIKSLDMAGRWAIPGLSDIHVHLCNEGNYHLARGFVFAEDDITSTLRAIRNLNSAMNAGITLVRDVGSYKRRGVLIRNSIERLSWNSPKITSCGNLLTSPSGHVHQLGREVKGIKKCRFAVREEIANGSDFIKVTNDPIGLHFEELKAIVEEAHNAGKKVACHAFTQPSIQMALDACVDTIEHGIPHNKDMRRQMIEQKTIIVPTFFCALKTCDDIEKSLIDENDLHIYECWLNDLKKYLPSAIENGIEIAAGTDAGYPPLEFDSVLNEVISLAKLGAKPLKAIQSTTSISSRACGLELEYGKLERDMHANVLILQDDPLKDIENIKKIYKLVLNGIII